MRVWYPNGVMVAWSTTGSSQMDCDPSSINCEVLEVEPHKRLRYSWRSGPQSSPTDTMVIFTLTPTPSGGTRLALEHSGFAPGNAFALEGAKKGWQRMLGERLGEVLGRQ